MLDGDEHPTVKTYDESKGRASKPNAFRDFLFFFSTKLTSSRKKKKEKKTIAFLDPNHHFQCDIWISTMYFFFFLTVKDILWIIER